jgi:ABC-type multidrug transport system ATPase subunit
LVSREHARLTWDSKVWALEDLNSSNGTFINGQRILGRTILDPGDRVEIATFVFLFTGNGLQIINTEGHVRIEARNLYKEVRDRCSRQTRRLLDQITLVIEPGEFVGIFGTSGSGKSTLLDALNGRRPASGGNVLYNNADLYVSFDQFRSTIGYVPQQDIVHRKISIRRALQYTARLRLPPDTSPSEIEGYITRVLDYVGLTEKADLPIDTPSPLSGGQLKRVSLGVELVANPKILFLDEVTSGLDAGTDKRMMHLFRDLTADNKTVVCVTHTLENIDACHLVVLLHQGKLVYFGPPQEVERYFGIKRLSDVYDILENAPVDQWVDKFRNSKYYHIYIEDRLNELPTPEEQDRSPIIDEQVRTQCWFNGSQAGILMRRYLDLILADRRNLMILLLQAPLIASVIGLVFNPSVPLPEQTAMENQISFMLVLSAIWFGCLNSARELVKELPIYLRERSVNLTIGPYLVSKLLPLAALCLLQCVLLLSIVSGMVVLSGNFVEHAWALFLAGMAATAMGLAVSAFVDSNDKAITMVPILLIPQVVLSDAIVRLGDISLAVAKATIIS